MCNLSLALFCSVAGRAELWTFSLSLPATDACPASRVQSAAQRPKGRILAYIRKHFPVSTPEFRAQSFTGCSCLYDILSELQKEDKFRKIGHGLYIAM